MSCFGHLPKRGESIDHAGLRFQVIRADSRRIPPCWSNACPRQTRPSNQPLPHETP